MTLVNGHKIRNTGRTRFKKGFVPWNKGKKGIQPWMNLSGFAKKGDKVTWSEERKKIFKKRMMGKNNPKWVKDRTKLKKSEDKMSDYAYKIWVKEVRIRDNWKCRLASSDCKGRLETHHIFDWKNYPELRYIINNGITLCALHHPRGREEEKRMIPILKELLPVSEE